MIADGVRGKVCLQCMHGHYDVALRLKERVIVNGSGVDGLYGSYKQEKIDGSMKRLSKADFDARRKKYLDKENDDAMVDQSRCYRDLANAKVLYPYRAKAVVNFLMACTWEQINRPRLKSITVNDYPEFGQHKGLWRPRGSQQIVAGTRELHDVLLKIPLRSYPESCKNIQAVYRDLGGM